ncbi:FUSC family protein [Mucilaginibacter roseus]|uniref:FUSC family protein n=1 Tax=Mucilaginibacter roseus TaxID=1528868 RepID=A0ABS8TYV3_9SPHI|nr:FUSC family membrane protein [Mucilaginibacter roseus]MCD8739567.1 FUSC family protein [Mucilaginibacter roseus]
MNPLFLLQKLIRFTRSEYFTDALRITISVVLPVLVLNRLGFTHAATIVGLGALNVGLTETAGTAADKRISLLISIPLSFIVSFMVAYSWPNFMLFTVVFAVIVFICSMLTVYGVRFSVLGISLIGLAIFTWGLKPVDSLSFALYIMGGAVWYYAVNYLYITLWPLRSLKHAIAECLAATAEFLEAKAPFYDVNVPLDISYRKLLALHVRINDKQELVRNLLIRDEKAMQASNSKGQELLKITECAIDLYDQITAIHYDYEFVRENFRINGVLELVKNVIKLQSHELYAVGDALQTNKRAVTKTNYRTNLQLYLDRLQYITDREDDKHVPMLIKLKHNIERIDDYINEIKTGLFKENVDIEYAHFVSVQDLSFASITKNLNLESPVFRFALRFTTSSIFGLVVSHLLNWGEYNYWVLLTILVIMRPSFYITQKRNKQRLLGSLAGIVIGFSILLLVKQQDVLGTIAVIFLVGFLTFLRTQYLVAVVFISAMIVIYLNIYTGGNGTIVIERIYDTLLGCLIAFAGAYLFPVWENKRLGFYIKQVLQANINYLEKLIDATRNVPLDVTSYKLARKSVYTSLAGLANAFAGMQGEPGYRKEQGAGVHRFQILNMKLSSMITSLFSVFRLPDTTINIDAQVKQIQASITLLQHKLQREADLLNWPFTQHADTVQKQHHNMSDDQDGGALLLQLAQEIDQCNVPDLK